MTTIFAQVIADSVGQHAPRLTTLLLRYPRWIHAEGRTHRAIRIGEDMEIDLRTPSLMEDANLSRNASSSRALPVAKLIADVTDDPAVPLYWGANQPGMQAGEELTGTALEDARTEWFRALGDAVMRAQNLAKIGAHKQIVNRVLEPFSHITVVVTGTKWENFFALRMHPAAEPHIRLLAERMYEAMKASTPTLLKDGWWHLPFVRQEDHDFLAVHVRGDDPYEVSERIDRLGLKLSVARCASTSYKTVDGFDMTLDRAESLHDKLITADPPHASPCEHQATPTGYNPRSKRTKPANLGGNLGREWVQYRKQVELARDGVPERQAAG